MTFLSRMSLLAALVLVSLMAVSSVSASSPSDVSHRRCLYRNYQYSGSQPLLTLTNLCSCDLNVQYTAFSSKGFYTNITRIPAWSGTAKMNNRVALGPMYASDLAIGGTQASKADCMPNLRYCLSAFPYFDSAAALLNQCNVDVAVQIPLGSLGALALPIYVPAWNGSAVGPNQLPNNAALLPALSFSLNTLRQQLAGPRLSFSSMFGLTVVQRSASAKADDHAFQLF